MKSAIIIEQTIAAAQNHGIALSVTPEFRLKASRESSALSSEWVATLVDNHETIIDHLCLQKFQYEVFRITLPDDIGFITKRLQHAPNRTCLAVVLRWHSEFEKGWQAEPNGIGKDNAGRFRANSWLREIDVEDFASTEARSANFFKRGAG